MIDKLLKNKVSFFWGAFGITVVILIWIWGFGGILDFSNSEDLKNIAVEFHGMVFDVILFGIVLTIYEKWRSKKDRIQSLKDELDDFRGWDEKEAMYRIVGIIRRLNKLGVSDVDLSNCFLEEADLRKLNLEGCNLKYANIQKADLRRTNLKNSDLRNADMRRALLVNVGMIHGANLDGVKLYKTKVVDVHWIKSLEANNIKGIDWIKKKYYVEGERLICEDTAVFYYEVISKEIYGEGINFLI